MEAIGRLVSGVAHDFNNLLTGIVLCSDLLLANLEKSSKLRRYANEIRSAGSQGATLIQQLLAVARPRAAEVQLLSFNDVIDSIRTLLNRLIGENVVLTTDLANDLSLTKIDPTQAQQVLLNLVLNARDAMPSGGRVTIRSRNCEKAAGIELTVSDTGCGMDAQTRLRVFEPFFTTKQPGKGNGLGLATVFDIVKRAGGTVEIESEPEKGTKVRVWLPPANVARNTPSPNQDFKTKFIDKEEINR